MSEMSDNTVPEASIAKAEELKAEANALFSGMLNVCCV
jgi:hypothetical protein